VTLTLNVYMQPQHYSKTALTAALHFKTKKLFNP